MLSGSVRRNSTVGSFYLEVKAATRTGATILTILCMTKSESCGV